ncbi:MAG: alpha/beta hydrolase [Maricaulaceae bacterium]
MKLDFLRAGRALIAASAVAGLAACVTPDAQMADAEPAPVTDHYADNDGVRIHYVAAGEGPLVVLIHGFPDYSGSWNALIPALSDAYRVVAVDLRGYNLSDQPEGLEPYQMPNLIADIDAVIAAEGYETATVLGHDWGAAIAWNFAFNYPEKLDNLIILSVPHPTNFMREMQNNPEQQANSQYARNFQQPGSEDALTAEGLAGFVSDEDSRAGYVEAFERSSFAAMMNYYRANYPSDTGPGATRPFVPADPPQIPVPLLVIHGMQDTALLSAGHNDTWERAAQDTTLLMIPDAGHFVQHDAADLVNATIRDWLDRRS